METDPSSYCIKLYINRNWCSNPNNDSLHGSFA